MWLYACFVTWLKHIFFISCICFLAYTMHQFGDCENKSFWFKFLACFDFSLLVIEISSETFTGLLQIWSMAWDFQQSGMCDQQSLRSACAYAQSDESLCLSLEYSMTVKLLTEHHLEFLSLTGGCTGSYESTLVKMPHCWKSHVKAH